MAKKAKPMVMDARALKRILALLIDIFVVGFVIMAPFRKLFQKLVPLDGFSDTYAYLESNPAIAMKINIISLFAIFLLLLYFILQEYFIGQTLGKKLMKIYVTDIAEKKPKLWQCIVRNLAVIPIFPFIILWVVDPLYMFFKKQRLSDIIAKTKVIEYFQWTP